MTFRACNNVWSGRECRLKALYFYIRPDVGLEVTGRCAVHERTIANIEYFDYIEITQAEAEVREVMDL